MDEAAARRVLLVRAFESTPGAPWSDADRDWADARTMRQTPVRGGADALIAERARIAVERLQSRDASLVHWLTATAAPATLLVALPLLAAGIGLASDAVGGAHRIDLLAPPLLALMAWNLFIYALLAWHGLRRAPAEPGPLRKALQTFGRQFVGRWSARPQRTRAAFVADWSRLGRPLHEARIARALHLAAAAFALGALASMYARGLAFEYRAGWDSTFLDAAGVRRLLGVVLWPATALAGFEMPNAAGLEALRFSNGPGENAARWIHAYAASVLALVVLPRLAVAAFAAWRARQLGQRFPIALDDAYFEALTRRLAAARPRAAKVVASAVSKAGGGPDVAPRSIELSLVSHTNVGKTTLARTLLRLDIGEVRDAEHVTFAAEGHTLVESAAGDRLELWDTPGFGDSVRLAERLAQSATPIGWFLGEVWDRLRHRAFWSSQHALRNVFERADVVLYLVDATPVDADSKPDDFAVVDAELRVLDLLAKPVLVLLNRLGPPRPAAELDAQSAAWRERLATRACVRGVLALDAFTRCWVQEGALLDAIAALVPADRQPAFARLRSAWQERSRAVFEQSMQVLARRVADAALDRETVAEGDWGGRLLDIGAGLGLRQRGGRTAREKAMQRLAERLATQVRASTDALIELHELGGHATDKVLAGLAEQVALTEPLDEGRAALWGGIASGALVGLKADLASGGLTLGGGMLAGGLVGALGAAGLARGYNQLRGVETPTLVWSSVALEAQLRAALLGYLAVAHFGHGRGVWSAPDEPAFWAEAIDATVAERVESLRRVLAQRDGSDAVATRVTQDLHAWLLTAGSELLRRLYPTTPLPV
ncbi:MAG: GTPase domain-containing protein [Burkholderiaceae bacterium]